MKTYFYILYVAKDIVNEGEDDIEEIFYVGRTVSLPSHRLAQHLSHARKQRVQNQKNLYICRELQEGKSIKIKVVEENESENLNEICQIENSLINCYRQHGYPLLNNRSGFSGSHKGTNARLVWTEDVISLLGKVFDKEIAQKMKCNTETVTNKRNELRIPPCKTFKWNTEYNVLLGTVSDRELGEIINAPRSVIAKQRKLLNIPSFPIGYDTTWTEEYEKMLGKMSDQALGELSRTSRNYVRKKRLEKRIAQFEPFTWSEYTLSLIGKVSDKEISLLVGCSEESVTRKRKSLGINLSNQVVFWTEEALKMLGEFPDLEIARFLGCSPANVKAKRNRMGIKRRKEIVWTEDKIAKLGKIPDSLLAKELGCSLTFVFSKRKELGIKSFRSNLSS